MNLNQFIPLLEVWDEKHFDSLSSYFQEINVLDHFPGREDKYKRIHLHLNDRHYFCPSILVGYPFGKNRGIGVIIELEIYEDGGSSSFHIGALLPKYLNEAKKITKKMKKMIYLVKEKIEEGEMDPIDIIDCSDLLIKNLENMTEKQIKNDLRFYQQSQYQRKK